MVMVYVLVAIGMLIIGGVFFWLSDKMRILQAWRINLHDALLREHRYFHGCEGGLGVDINGGISHFTPMEGNDYDASRKVRL